ncbi:hypothetical protein POX_e07046 [Penicillium oxalicum]|uniref:hypothetical protein n=1 Tax=Penicillium oxalicum TaxID=69781 RepID=UPI0020B6E065|nr:hypothetical protein POX_e07046 [Penicillium oxalicum]KAI2789020.1 hypothetical protein POX_e07046 [Penicillium oxalicum]
MPPTSQGSDLDLAGLVRDHGRAVPACRGAAISRSRRVQRWSPFARWRAVAPRDDPPKGGSLVDGGKPVEARSMNCTDAEAVGSRTMEMCHKSSPSMLFSLLLNDGIRMV